jgi:hypothetical protein
LISLRDTLIFAVGGAQAGSRNVINTMNVSSDTCLDLKFIVGFLLLKYSRFENFLIYLPYLSSP